ncbi:MAG: DUF4132 domain-containing protein [Paracoccus sp. (in: a-proteobacteria)]|nr:DUF4132 domain-containing protein [Paracoccus sp. (in: a-proteobacteria)]
MFTKLRSILGKKSGDGGSDDPLLAAFAHLDRLAPGTAAQLLAFVDEEQGRPLLTRLAAQRDAVHRALQEKRLEAYRKTFPDAQLSDYLPAAPDESNLSRAVFCAPGDPARMVRLIEAGMAAQLLDSGRFWMSGVKQDLLTPASVNLFRIVHGYHGNRGERIDAPPLDDVLAAAALMGADLEAILASGIWNRYSHAHLQRYGYDWLARASVETFARALKQLDALMREQLLALCLEGQTYPQGDMLPLLFALTDDGATKVRDVARRLMLAMNDPRLTAMATERLSSGKATSRAIMVQLLGEIGSDEARAALAARQPQEKTRAVQLLIDQYLSSGAAAPAGDPDRPGYEAVDGRWITPPDVVIPPDGGEKPFGAADEKELAEIAARTYEEDLDRARRAAEAGRSWSQPPELDTSWKHLIRHFNGEFNDVSRPTWLYSDWAKRAIKQLSPGRIIRLWAMHQSPDYRLYGYGSASGEWVQDQLDAGALDIRVLIAATTEALARYPLAKKPDLPPEEHVFRSMLDAYSYVATLPDEAIWPLIAGFLPVLAENLPPHETSSTQNARALRLIARLPAVPRQLLSALINTSTAEARSVRAAAQALLVNVPEVTPDVVAALSDSRSGVRANAAAFLALRGDRTALPELVAHLRKEKTDLGRAALITAIATLGGDTSAWLGAPALEKEAAGNAAKLKGDKIDWLAQQTAPRLHWADGSPVAPDLLDGWLKLALKLKRLEDGAGLFRLYLDQLRAEDAAALGDWVLASWIAYDTDKPAKEEIFQEKLEQARALVANAAPGSYYARHTPEFIAQDWTRHAITHYPNSGAHSKGILALALAATPQTQARMIAAYLKQHGKRVAQAKAMLEVLAWSGSNDALQIVVATATRFKQRSVREHAEALVARVADERGWSADELADRSVPSGGLDEAGVLDLPMGEDEKPYQARLDAGLSLLLFNPDGKPVKSLPGGTDENSRESKAALTAAKKVLKEVVEKQSRRLYEAMLNGRDWPTDAWQADLRAHPILGRLVERLIWRGLDGDGAPRSTFRPTAEGDLMDASGDDVTLDGVARIEIAHATALSPNDLAAWARHLDDFEVTPLFPQIGRAPLSLPEAPEPPDQITDREGWVLDLAKLQSLATKLGYERAQAGDGGSFHEVEKSIEGAGYRAIISFSGSYFGADNHPVALIGLGFTRLPGRRMRMVPLADIPPRLLSECWNDLHDIAKAGAYDPDWKKVSLW